MFSMNKTHAKHKCIYKTNKLVTVLQFFSAAILRALSIRWSRDKFRDSHWPPRPILYIAVKVIYNDSTTCCLRIFHCDPRRTLLEAISYTEPCTSVGSMHYTIASMSTDCLKTCEIFPKVYAHLHSNPQIKCPKTTVRYAKPRLHRILQK